MTNPPDPAATFDSSTADVLDLPNTTNTDPAWNAPFGVALGAPSTRSASPSPLMSPAPETSRPTPSPEAAPLMTKPAEFVETSARNIGCGVTTEPNTTSLVPARSLPF